MLLKSVCILLILSFVLILGIWGIRKKYLKSALFGTLSLVLFMLVLFFLIFTLVIYVQEYPIMILATPDYHKFEYQLHLVLERLDHGSLPLNEYNTLKNWLEHMFSLPNLTDAETEFLILVQKKLETIPLTRV